MAQTPSKGSATQKNAAPQKKGAAPPKDKTVDAQVIVHGPAFMVTSGLAGVKPEVRLYAANHGTAECAVTFLAYAASTAPASEGPLFQRTSRVMPQGAVETAVPVASFTGRSIRLSVVLPSSRVLVSAALVGRSQSGDERVALWLSPAQFKSNVRE